MIRVRIFLFVFLFFFILFFHINAPVYAIGTPTYLQGATTNTTNLVTDFSTTFQSAVTTGSTVVVAISSWNGTNTAAVSSVTDNVGNTYTKAVEDPTPNTNALEPLSIWYAQNVTGGTITVTAHTTTAASMTLAIHEYSGVDTISVLDRTHQQSATSASVSSGNTKQTSVANEIIFGAANYQNNSNLVATAGTGFTLEQSQTKNDCCEVLYTEDKAVITTGVYNASFTFPQSVTYRAVVITLKGAIVPTPTITASPILTPTVTQVPTHSVAGIITIDANNVQNLDGRLFISHGDCKSIISCFF